MMDWTAARMIAHLLLIGWAIAIAFLLVLARGKTVRVVHVPVAVMGLTLFGLWILGLSATMKSMGIVSRGAYIPFLASMELGAAICAWVWLALSVRYSFTFSVRTNANNH